MKIGETVWVEWPRHQKACLKVLSFDAETAALWGRLPGHNIEATHFFERGEVFENYEDLSSLLKRTSGK